MPGSSADSYKLRARVSIDLDGNGIRIDQPVFVHAMPFEQSQFAPAVITRGTGRQDLDCEVRRVARDLPHVEQMLPLGHEQQHIRLHHVVVAQHDVNRRYEDRPAVRLHVRGECQVQTPDDELMKQDWSWNLEDLAVVQFVPAAILGPSLQIRVAHALLRSLHARHFIIVNASCVPPGIIGKSLDRRENAAAIARLG